MNVFEVDYPLVIEFSNGMRRNIAELFQTENGLVFVDVWWFQASFHPIHEVKGQITGNGPWVIHSSKYGDVIIKKL